MGAFYGSVHIRTDDRDAVLTAAKAVARKDTRFLVGPPIRGWVAVYPSGNGQDDGVARRLAKRFVGDVIYVVVHDDDIFAYSYFRDGKVVDRYESNSDYFGAVSDREKAKVRGQPDKLVQLLPDPSRLDALRDLLAPAKSLASIFASDLLLKFAELLRLSNVDTAYEYLMEEEDGPEQRDQFIHVPDLFNEKAAKAAAETRHIQVKKRWHEEGLLLLEERRPTKSFGKCLPQFSPDGRDGFLVGWADLMSREPVPLEHYRPPWTLPASAMGIEAPLLRCLCLSPSGRYLATGAGLSARLWDFPNREVIAEVSHPQGVHWIGFSSDEEFLISLGTRECYVTSVTTRQRVSAPSIQNASHAACHPGGTLVVADQKKLHLVDIRSGAVRNSLRIGDRRELQGSDRSMLALFSASLSNFDPVELEKRLKEELDQVDERVKAMVERLAAAGVKYSEEQTQAMKTQMIQAVENSRAFVDRQRQKVESGRLEVSVERASSLAVSRDGRRLFVGTDRFVRVYEWEAVSAAAEYFPDATFRCQSATTPTKEQPSRSGHIYAMELHETGQQLIFGGVAGRLECLDLRTGGHKTLCDLPGNPAVFRLALSSDSSRLACCVLPNFPSQGGAEKPPELHIWDFPALLRGVQ